MSTDLDLQGAAQATALAALALDRAGNDAASALTLLMGAISVVASRAGDRGKRAELSVVSDTALAEARRQRDLAFSERWGRS